MRAVALRLEGPLQSWGGPAVGDDRPTLDLPTKSGVIGLVAAAVGIRRTDVPALVVFHRSLTMGVRADRRGRLGVDFQTVAGVTQADGTLKKDPVVSRRSYLYDASFLILLTEQGDSRVCLEDVVKFLRHPRSSLCLGRKACVPAVPVLAHPEVLEGKGWPDLWEQLPFPAENEPVDLFIEGDHRFTETPRLTRRRTLRVRDALLGPLPRMYGERFVTHFRFDPPGHPEDTVDRWFPAL